MSSSSSNCCLESTPCWHRLALSMKVLFEHQANMDTIDYDQLAASQRMKYEDFERIFYHLLLIIDTNDTRRKFKSHYPARNKEEQNVFIELVAKAINDRQPQLHSRRVASSQLRMFGGGPFRSLLSSLVKVANEREVEKLKSKLDLSKCDFGVLLDKSNEPKLLNTYQEPLKRMTSRVRSLGVDLKSSLEELKNCEDDAKNSLKQAQELWSQLEVPRSLEQRKIISSFSEISQELFDSLGSSDLSRLESIHADIERAMEKVNAIHLPKQQEHQQAISEKQEAPVKRLSQFIRDKKSKFDPDREFMRDALQHCQPERMLHQLEEHNQRVKQLIEMWRQELELAEENLLKKPEILERYKQFEMVITKINLNRITIDKQATIDEEALEEILKQFPDQRAAIK